MTLSKRRRGRNFSGLFCVDDLVPREESEEILRKRIGGFVSLNRKSDLKITNGFNKEILPGGEKVYIWETCA